MLARKRIAKTTAAALLAATLIVAAGCGSQPAQSESASIPSASASPASSAASADRSAEYDKALSGNGLVTGFIGERFYDDAVESEDDALAAAESALSRIGGDSTTKLELVEIRPTETGTTYYTFRQQAGDVAVHGAAVKLVVDKDKHVAGLVSAILPGIQLESLESWEATQEQAEQAVLDECADNGNGSARIVSDATEQTLVPLLQNSTTRRYAWVVYTNNYLTDYDAGYLAHYVSADGDYLYALPVAEPSNADSLAGETTTFAFDKMEQGTWSGTVTKHDGTTLEVTVPTLTDPETGDVLLADGTRKIICLDYAAFSFDEKLSPRIETDGRFADNEVLVYDTFIKVWDFYDGVGWTGPDGDGTPTALLMDLVDENGNVEHNAYYQGRNWGFQAFAFNRDEADGECYDIIGHEFTHCVTDTLKTVDLYRSDAAAINEGLSDVFGNLIEMLIAYDPDGAWLFGENEGTPIRSQKDPHSHQQPEFVWDVYYGPAPAQPTSANDNGGAHINSSLLSQISYKLYQAGMQPEDQVYFWMNVQLSMTPSTDFPQMASLLPWCMEQAGYPQYVEAVKAAIDDGRLTTTEVPAQPPAGTGFVKIALPEKTRVNADDMRFCIVPSDDPNSDDYAATWVGADQKTVIAAVSAGDYVIRMDYYDGGNPKGAMVLTEAGWAEVSGDASQAGKVFSVAAGETVEIPSNGLEA